MLLMEAMYNAIITEMLSDVNYLADDDTGDSTLSIFPVVGPITPTRELALGDLVQAASGFWDPPFINLGGPGGNVVVDSEGNRGISLFEPANGFTFRVDDPTDGPYTVYGFALGKAATNGVAPTELLAVGVLTTPVVFDTAAQQIQCSSVLGLFTGDVFGTEIQAITP